MQCAQVTERLSEYVDGLLDRSTRERLENHLAQCQSCSGELAALRAYLKATDSVERLRAPADFLEKVHERLEQPTFFEKAAAWLFFPLKLKLPIELAGVAMASLLIILLFHGVEPGREMLSLSSPVKAPVSAPAPLVATESKEGQTAVAPQASGQAADRPTLAAKTKGALEREAARSVELVLWLKPAAPVSAVAEAESNKPMREGKPPSGPGSAIREQTSGMKARSAPPSPASPAVVGEAGKSGADGSGTIHSRLKELVDGVGGSVLSVEYGEKALLPKKMVVQVPARSYRGFLDELRSLGRLEGRTERVDVADRESPVELHIMLLPAG
ncbi:MAG TPA: zf-HC2 domain-containing protein [Syntrophobacteraceae bacterium]|nr:zf-HC2 domain-containing protein [Syntrophobacteraceae bacterium]